jgi:hypothetical protein
MYNEQLLGACKNLSGLRALNVKIFTRGTSHDGLEALCQLTGLNYLDVIFTSIAQAKLLQLTRLQQLTALTLYANLLPRSSVAFSVTTEVSHFFSCVLSATLLYCWGASKLVSSSTHRIPAGYVLRHCSRTVSLHQSTSYTVTIMPSR